MIPKEIKFPVFEANQVLTNHHLNDLFEFLDEQNRLTRSNLVGNGIVCGLEVSVAADSNSITISKGCGVTSEGYLAVVPDDPTTTTPNLLTLQSWKTYTAPADIAYPPFDFNGQQVALWELFPVGEPGALPLGPAFLQDKVVLLFVECALSDLKNCSPNSCDDKGQQVIVTLRKLLINRTDLDQIILNAQDSAANIGFSMNQQLALPDIRLRRFDVQNTGVDTAMEIFTAYQKILFEAQADGSPNLFVAIEKALMAAWEAFFPVVGNIAPANPFTGKLTAVQAKFSTNFFNSNIIVSQYFYDYLSDLLAAYEEFRQRAMEWWALCCPPSGLFPRHLMLGELQGTGVGGRKVYRHYFRPSPAQVQQATLGAEVRNLFQRLVLMVQQVDLPTAPFRGTPQRLVRITPSRLGPHRLSDKAIPYYFRVNTGVPPLYQHWSHEKSSVGKAALNLSYHSDKYPSPPFVQKALEYDHEPNNFYRIEGHIGLNWRDVVKDLLNRTRRYRLPFDVLALNADQFAVTKDPQPGRCIDNDLNVIYKIWVNEASCLFKKKIGFFSSFDIANNRFTKYAAKAAATGDARNPLTSGSSATGLSTSSFGGISLMSANLAALRINIDDSVVVAPGSIGSVIKPNLPTGGGVSAADLIIKANDALKDDVKVRTMTVEQYNVVVEQPVRLIGAFSELADAIPDDSKDLDIAVVSGKYNDLRLAANKYLDDLIKLPDDFVFLPPKERDSALDELKSLLDNCLDKRLEELKAEIDKRKQAAAEAIWFSNYVKKHPDIQHKAGVIEGGTFIIVFRETPNTPPPTSTPGFVRPPVFAADTIANISNLLIASEAANISTTPTSALGLEPAILAPKRLTDLQTGILSEAFSAAGLTLDLGNLISEGLFEISPDSVIVNPRLPNVPEGVVIADFFVPYRCCSDCPPVQFVLPPPRPSFSAEPACPTANGAVVTINIISGESPFEIKKGTAETAPYERLNDNRTLNLPIGETVLTLRDSQGGESMPVTVQIAPPMTPDLGEIVCNAQGTAFNVNIFLVGGKAPFLVNGQTPLESVVVAGGFRLVAGPFANGAHVLQISDSAGCVTPPITVERQCLPPAPIANPDVATTAFNTPVNINVLANDIGSGLVVSIPTPPSEGAVVVNADRSLNFTPSTTVAGRATTFSYRVSDSFGQSADSTVTVQVGARPCNLPCGGTTERSRYPLWVSKPETNFEMVYRFTEIARLRIRNEAGIEIFNENLTDIFRAEFTPNFVLDTANFNQRFRRLFRKINERVEARLGADFFSMESNETNSGGTLAIERFACHSFIFEVMFGVAVNQFQMQARWIYTEKSVVVQQTEPRAEQYEVAKFGIDIIEKCATPPTTKPAGRVTIANIQDIPNRLGLKRAVTNPTVNVDTSRFDWVLEYNKTPFLTGRDITPDFGAIGKARLIVVDKDGNWDYFEKIIGGAVNPSEPREGGLVPPGRPGGGNIDSPTVVTRPTRSTRGAAQPPSGGDGGT